ncbi:50S ribosomal protein L14 [Syncephalis plumigaleata]|nr:50S ribosomal protein L14 [Syncephalis plumigaleata]
MIQLKSVLNVIDNSGAVLVECIKVLRNARFARTGDEIVVAVRQARPISQATSKTSGGTSSSGNAQKLRKGDVRRAVIVRTKKELQRPDGRIVRFDDNACVLVDKGGQPLGTRVLGLVSAEVREKGWPKVVALAPKVI